MKISNLNKTYNNRVVLDISSLNIGDDKITALMGSNGSGKSTLLRILAGVERDFSGEIDRNFSVRSISLLLPEPRLLKRSVRANFEFVARNYGFFDEIEARIDESLELVGLDRSFLAKRHFELSSGQIQRIAFALVLITRNKFILLDEPTNSVDLATSKLFAKSVLYMKRRYGCGFLIASHDGKWLSSVAEDRIFLYNARVSEFELKNIFGVKNSLVDFESAFLKLPIWLENSQKVAINQRKIRLSRENLGGYNRGILHSVSMVFGEFVLIKIKYGEFLIKSEISKEIFDTLRLITGDEIYFIVEEDGFLKIE